MTDRSCVVIGGGVIGLSTAYFLQKEGYKVTVVEKGSIGGACSHGNAGLIVPSHIIPIASKTMFKQGLKSLIKKNAPFRLSPFKSPKLIDWGARYLTALRNKKFVHSTQVLSYLLSESAFLFEQLHADLKGGIGYKASGLVSVFCQNRTYAKALSQIPVLQYYGVKVEALSAGQIKDKFPNLFDRVVGGLYYSQDAHLTPTMLTQKLAKKIEENGGEILAQTEVDQFVGDKNFILVKSGERLLPADQVVLAGGCWTPQLVGQLRERIPLQPAKGYSVTYQSGPEDSQTPVVLEEERVIATPMQQGYRFAGLFDLTGFSSNGFEERVSQVERVSKVYFPSLSSRKIQEKWSGLRPCSPDGLPIISRSKRYKNLFYATGHGMLGVSLGPITGRLVAQMLKGDSLPILRDLSLERFAFL